ncbi:MAG: T9SS type A sorting domain-containing protein [Candidatus Coatesbacteria bacterium]|nr:MAG: T9SS type A sorting domain-containing protein [Candidatus Coatesbacteria bacterium]
MRYASVVIALLTPVAVWSGWTSEIVASEGNVGVGCSLAVDRWNRPHIAYVDSTQDKVMYARYSGSSWEFQTVASDASVGGETALALDAFGNPHVIFNNSSEGELSYAYRSGGTWQTEPIEEGASVGLNCSLAVWPAGPRVSYTVPSGFDTHLKYAVRNGGSWQTEYVLNTGTGGEFNDIIIDDEGAPHIFYFHGTSGNIKHAIRGASEWSSSDVAPGIDCDAFVGPGGKIHLSFPTTGPDALDYAVSAGGNWDIENVAAAKGSPTYGQICVNVAGDVYISYFDRDEFDLHVVAKKGAVWTDVLLAAEGYVGVSNSIAAGPNGYPLVAYYDATNGDLELARYDPLTDVELAYFTAKRSGAGVNVRWAARDDSGVAGYNLYRAAAGGERQRLNPSLLTGASPFLYRDGAAESAVAYRYWLELVAASGTRRTYGPAAVPPAGNAHSFALLQNVPNPVADATTFTFELPAGADVRLGVYDAAGRRVAAPAEGYYGPGRHDVPFACGLAPGVYLYRLEAGANVAARKMVVVE